MSVSLIITTYNWWQALSLALDSIKRQTVKPDELIIVDDGSGKETKDLIERKRTELSVVGIQLEHCWQPDEGFRAAQARNLGLKKARGDYIIMTDQDMVLDPYFVQDHLAASRYRRLVSGTRTPVNRAYTEKIMSYIDNPSWLQPSFCRGIPLNRSFKRIRNHWLSLIRSISSYNYNGVLTCNISFWRKDALFINGFNTEFVGWGFEDFEFYSRLRNALVTERYILKHAAIAYHLYHPENSKATLPENDKILMRTINEKICFCRHGIIDVDIDDYCPDINYGKIL